MADHKHKWWQHVEIREVKVVNGKATMPWGAEITTQANIVTYPEPTGDFVCRGCGERKVVER